jgi:hypothetical protein
MNLGVGVLGKPLGELKEKREEHAGAIGVGNEEEELGTDWGMNDDLWSSS